MNVITAKRQYHPLLQYLHGPGTTSCCSLHLVHQTKSSDLPKAVLTCVQNHTWESGATSPGKKFQVKMDKTTIFFKVCIKLVHEECPQRSICVQIDELASLDANNLPLTYSTLDCYQMGLECWIWVKRAAFLFFAARDYSQAPENAKKLLASAHRFSCFRLELFKVFQTHL